jgi:hypothetical protein
MCANYIIPFLLGVFVGQEIQDIPRIKPYLESTLRKAIEIGREIIANAQTKDATPPKNDGNYGGNNGRRGRNFVRFFSFGQDD